MFPPIAATTHRTGTHAVTMGDLMQKLDDKKSEFEASRAQETMAAVRQNLRQLESLRTRELELADEIKESAFPIANGVRRFPDRPDGNSPVFPHPPPVFKTQVEVAVAAAGGALQGTPDAPLPTTRPPHRNKPILVEILLHREGSVLAAVFWTHRRSNHRLVSSR